MDPNEALKLARAAAVELTELLDKEEPIDRDTLDLLVSSFRALDEWLSRDGFLPTDWRAEEDK